MTPFFDLDDPNCLLSADKLASLLLRQGTIPNAGPLGLLLMTLRIGRTAPIFLVNLIHEALLCWR
jgi:hypothetical protein